MLTVEGLSKTLVRLKKKEDTHKGQCQFDFCDEARETLICCLNQGHRVILYSPWRVSTIKEMFGMGILVGAAREEGLLQKDNAR